MKSTLFIPLFLFFLSTFVFAQDPVGQIALFSEKPELGKIESIDNNGLIVFYKGDLDIKVGDELRINERGVLARIVVDSVIGDRATATILGVRSGLFGERVNVRKLNKVHLETKFSELNWLSFNLGGNSTKKVSGFGGINGFLGMDVGGHFHEIYTWDLLLQADTYGKDSFGTEIRRSAYMLGLGRDIDKFNFSLFLGTIDTMTITKDAAGQGSTNPYTGQYYNNKVQHLDEFGYMVAATYRYEISYVTYKKRTGFSINPRFSYANTFTSGKYGGYTSAGISLAMWLEDFL